MNQQAINMPKLKLPIGISDFKELRDGGYQFVDKTLFIKDIIEDGAKVILIIRPRRFGKTINLSMLYHFLKHLPKSSEHLTNKRLFADTQISNDLAFCAQYQQRFPVIFISFKDIKKSSFTDAFAAIETLVAKLYQQHRYLLEQTELYPEEKAIIQSLIEERAKKSHLEAALNNLSEYLYRVFKQKAYLLIDEYDTPITAAYLSGYHEQMVDLMRNILGQGLKDNAYLSKGVITGITQISQESIFSGLNNIDVYSLLRKDYGQYFGFTDQEVAQLLAQADLSTEHQAIKRWYNGYQIGPHTLYNPWSILSCIKQAGQLQPYWINTSDNALIKKLLRQAAPSTKALLEALLQGKAIERVIQQHLSFPDLEKNTQTLWMLLLFSGYLKITQHQLDDDGLHRGRVMIPNQEVMSFYTNTIKEWFSDAVDANDYQQFIQAFIEGNPDKIGQYIKNYISHTGSYFDFNKNTPEQVFHGFILGLIAGLKDHYFISSNRESGLGRYDVALIPFDRQRSGILLEFKIADTPKQCAKVAKQAIAQIKQKQYATIFDADKVNNIVLLGLAFCGKHIQWYSEQIGQI